MTSVVGALLIVVAILAAILVALLFRGKRHARAERALREREERFRRTIDEATLDRFIANPDEVVANNNMKPYKGTSDAAVRKKIIEFLKSSSAGS